MSLGLILIILLVIFLLGGFSGRLQFGGRTLPFHGRFYETGFAELAVPRRKQLPLILDLSLDLFQPDHLLQGQLVDGTRIGVVTGRHL